uniref:RNase H type-1 domain-containing protein n=1 Tax=Brassica oleracea TaxID=3712 RepID=A0A3P6EXA2_BRAOL|nr:unnamed protein product [Brassica oleracea]
MEVIQSATSEAESWRLAQINPEVTEENTNTPLPELLYRPPQRPFCRFDASWKRDDTRHDGRLVIENEDGTTTFGSFASNRSLSPLHAEFGTLLWAMKSSLILGHESMAFESDCLQLVRLIEEEEEWPSLMAEFDEFLTLRSKFLLCSISFVSHLKNVRADRLAKGARSQGFCFSHVNSEVPAWLVLDTTWLESS